MKKLFISIIALVCAMTMSAQTTADVTLRLQSQSGSVCELYLFAGPDLAATPERGSFMANASNPEDVNIFAIDPTNSNRYASFGNEALVNIPVGIITSKEAAALQNYTIHFEVYEDAEVLKLKDLVTGTETNITDGGSYAFTIAAATNPSYVEGTYSVIAERFVINYNPAIYVTSATTNEYGWASFSYNANLQPSYPGGLKIYKGEISGSVLNLTQMNYVAANEGVVLYGEPNKTYYFAAGTGTTSFANNDLKPSSAWTGAAENIFCLKGEALYQYTGENMPANKAYLQVGGASAPRRISLQVNAEQGVENVKAGVKAEKFVGEDGQILIKRGENVFNLQGQIVK